MSTNAVIMFAIAAVFVAFVAFTDRSADRGVAALAALVMVAIGILVEVTRR